MRQIAARLLFAYRRYFFCLVQAATQAFKACQPYALPAEKYNEWKTLDITLSPRDMAGG